MKRHLAQHFSRNLPALRSKLIEQMAANPGPSGRFASFSKEVSSFFGFGTCEFAPSGRDALMRAVGLAQEQGALSHGLEVEESFVAVPRGHALLEGLSFAKPFFYENPKDLQSVLEHEPRIVAMVVEPFQVARGLLTPVPQALELYPTLPAMKGISVVVDETISGLGRCGRKLASENTKFDADFLVLGDVLGAGLLSSGAVLSNRLESHQPLTFPGAELNAFLAKEVIDLIVRENLIAEAEERGQVFEKIILRNYKKFPELNHFTRQGLLLSLQLNSSRKMMHPLVFAEDFEKFGIHTEAYDPYVTLAPPLDIDDDETASFMLFLEDYLREAKLSGKKMKKLLRKEERAARWIDGFTSFSRKICQRFFEEKK